MLRRRVESLVLRPLDGVGFQLLAEVVPHGRFPRERLFGEDLLQQLQAPCFVFRELTSVVVVGSFDLRRFVAARSHLRNPGQDVREAFDVLLRQRLAHYFLGNVEDVARHDGFAQLRRSGRGEVGVARGCRARVATAFLAPIAVAGGRRGTVGRGHALGDA